MENPRPLEVPGRGRIHPAALTEDESLEDGPLRREGGRRSGGREETLQASLKSLAEAGDETERNEGRSAGVFPDDEEGAFRRGLGVDPADF